MALQIIIQVDKKREDNTYASKLDTDNNIITSGEIARAILELEKMKIILLDIEMDSENELEEEKEE